MAFRVATTVVIDSNSNVIIGSGTTASRPVSPPAGTLWFNTSLNVLEGWNGIAWIALCQ